MNREPFSIHPTLEAHIDPLAEEEFRLLEESILAEGVRDPLVVWREENVLVDGHHRKAICDRHGLPYSVTYLSFPDIEAAKAWMDLNQLGRRNLTKEKRDEMIRRLAARGVKQKDIAEKVGLDRSVVTKIINRDVQNAHEPTVNATTPAAEIESLQRKLEEAEAARRSTEQRLSAIQSDLKLAKMALDVTPEVVERDKDFLRNKLKEEQERHDAERKELIAELNAAKQELKAGAAPKVVEKVVEKPVVREVVREVVPESVQARLKDLEAQVRKTNANEQYLRNMEDRKVKLQNEIMTLKEQATRGRIEATFEKTVTFIQTEKFLASQMLEFAERGELTIEQVDQVEGILGNVLAETNNALIALRKIRGEFRQGGGLRAL